MLLMPLPNSDPSPPSYDACWLVLPTYRSTLTTILILLPPDPTSLLLHLTLLSAVHIVAAVPLSPTRYLVDVSHARLLAPSPTIVTLLPPVLAVLVGPMLLVLLAS
jgi:hypothetical protein